MTIAIDADCALAYWMSSTASRDTRKQASEKAFAKKLANRDLPEWARAPDGKFHCFATDPRKRLHSKDMLFRYAKTDLPEGSLAEAGDGLVVASPECCYFRLATTLTFAELVKAGMLLSANFAFDDMGKLVGRRKPPTCTKLLRSYIDEIENANGVKLARQAVRSLSDAAASPPEIDTSLLFSLPVRHGGYGCSMPELNGHIKLHPKIARGLGYEDCYCDLLWRKQKCVVEYTSELHHSGYRKQAKDEMRRAALEAMGYRVFLLTKTQLYNQAAFEGFARPVLRVLGKRMPENSARFRATHYELRKTLLYEPSWIVLRACGG